MTFVAIYAAVMLLATSCEFNINITPDVSLSESTATSDAGYKTVDVTASGKWFLTLYFLDSDYRWATLTSTEGRGSKDGIILSYEENTFSGPRSLRVILTASGQDIAVTFTQGGSTSEGGPSANPGWIELPALAENEDCRFYWHDMTQQNGNTCRNYSFLWDRENLVAHWVAYPLNTALIGTGSRTDRWGYDPKVPREEQPELYKGYRGGYDRGHQLPSADRLSANPSTFYFTNMTPQIGHGFNQTVWANFEGKVREWSRSADTLYVVTGCVIEGSLGKAQDNLGKAVTVPGGYFKALLWYNHASTQSFGQWSAAGFWFDHKSGASCQTMSIDGLEEITGMDFFVNLASRVGRTQADMIEAAEPGTFWD